MRHMKRILASIAAVCVIAASSYAQHEYHVSPLAKKNGKGTLASPFNSIQAAQKKVAKVSKRMQEDIIVYLHGGTYTLSEPLVLTPKDGGQHGHTITYKAYQKEKPQKVKELAAMQDKWYPPYKKESACHLCDNLCAP